MENPTPWQRVVAKFGLSPAELARKMDRHRSKIVRALKDKKGLISGRDQQRLLEIARDSGVDLTPSDLTPQV